MAELHVSKKTISKLFTEMQNRKFIIPDFQRPYKWDVEKCETLWNDIENFTVTEAKSGSDYFLGTIVSYLNEEKNLEIIDGQQRITSFMLLLRSFYKKLENMEEDEDVLGLKNQLAPCIWDINPISQKIASISALHIESLVATEEDNEIFHEILKTGNANTSAVDNYSLNFNFFKSKCDEYASFYPMQWKQLCVTILQKCIVLPIECDTPETALTIFSTLNDRGLPLADSDIFKAQLYRNLDSIELRKEFTSTWKELTLICKESFISIDDVFRYYSHVLRAKIGDKSKEVGLRKFYADNKYARLKEIDLMSQIMSLADFWRSVNTDYEPDEDCGYKISSKAAQYLHCLSCYPNEFWKYITSVFFIKNKGSETFDNDFCIFLQKLSAFLYAKFIIHPTVNAIKDDIYSACISVNISNNFTPDFELDEDLITSRFDEYASSKITKGLLLLEAYQKVNQNDLIHYSVEIEHIFPKRWQETNYNGWSYEDALFYLDRFGNKIVFEKKLNIQAGNGYFGRKKEKYRASKIEIVKALGDYKKNDWLKEDIEIRENEFKSTLLNFFKTHLSN